jgi:hypothetical protein
MQWVRGRDHNQVELIQQDNQLPAVPPREIKMLEPMAGITTDSRTRE